MARLRAWPTALRHGGQGRCGRAAPVPGGLGGRTLRGSRERPGAERGQLLASCQRRRHRGSADRLGVAETESASRLRRGAGDCCRAAGITLPVRPIGRPRRRVQGRARHLTPSANARAPRRPAAASARAPPGGCRAIGAPAGMGKGFLQACDLGPDRVFGGRCLPTASSIARSTERYDHSVRSSAKRAAASRGQFRETLDVEGGPGPFSLTHWFGAAYCTEIWPDLSARRLSHQEASWSSASSAHTLVASAPTAVRATCVPPAGRARPDSGRYARRGHALFENRIKLIGSGKPFTEGDRDAGCGCGVFRFATGAHDSTWDNRILTSDHTTVGYPGRPRLTSDVYAR